MAITFTDAVRTSRAQALVTAAGSGAQIKLYTGTAPAVSAAATGTLLGTLTCSATLGTVTNGVLTFNAITQDSAADATGTATYGRLVNAAGTTTLMQFSVGTSGADLNLNSTSIVTGGPIAVTSAVLTEAA